jgi:heptosyltransferase-2/heptosyltransferase-3
LRNEELQARRDVARILHPTVIYFGRLGDMVMLTAMLSLLRQRFRAPCYVVGAGSWNEGVFAGNPDVANLWSFDRHLPFLLSRQWLSTARALRAAHPGPIYICDIIARKVARARRVVRLAGVEAERCVFMEPDDPAHPDRLWLDRLLALGQRNPAALSGADLSGGDGRRDAVPQVYVCDAERATRDAWLRRHDSLDRPLVVVQACNHRSVKRDGRERWRARNSDDKSWPVERWAQLLGRIHARLPEARIVLRGARDELPVLREIQAAASLPAVLVPDPDLRTLIALCERAHSAISLDTGPAHVAAALGVPLVVLYGAQSPRRWLPRSPGSPVVAVGGPPAFARADEISVDAVFDAWCSVLEPAESAASGCRG